MKLAKQQHGLSTIVLILILAILGYTFYVGLKVFPAYMDYFSIKSAIDGVADEMQTRKINKTEFIDLMNRRLDINYIDMSKLLPSRDGCEKKSKKDVFLYKTSKNGVTIGVNYEQRVPLVANVDFLLTFDYERKVENSNLN